jgi:hypothetical protein
VRACVRARVCVCVRVLVRAHVCVCVRVCVEGDNFYCQFVGYVLFSIEIGSVTGIWRLYIVSLCVVTVPSGASCQLHSETGREAWRVIGLPWPTSGLFTMYPQALCCMKPLNTKQRNSFELSAWPTD